MGTQLPRRKGAQQPPPTFRPMSIVAKLSPIPATAELVFDVTQAYIESVMTCFFTLYAFSSLLGGKYMFCWRYVLVILIERQLHLHTCI